MCSADISPLSWEWVPDLQKYVPNMRSTHVCRNFEKIQEWARERVVKGFDPAVHPV
jgi:hypothetical protein